MRIISGEFGGRTLLPPPSNTTRPITDRAKQSIFDGLSAWKLLENVQVLDCFAGTGSMGLESLSRGARRVIFIERDRGALINLRKNIESLGIQDKCLILPIDAYGCLNHEALSLPGCLQVAFVDPPYLHMESGRYRDKIDRLVAGLASQCLSPKGIISLRHPSRVSIDPGGLGVQVTRNWKYGDMAITWCSPLNGEPGEPETKLDSEDY